jgi:dsDNA-specific endonuclease/ATPase MutS2
VNAARCDAGFFDRAAGVFKCLRYISGSLDNLEAGLTPDETELLEIKGFALMLNSLKSWYDESGLKLESIDFSDLEPVVSLLNPDKTIVSSFHVHDAYSERLKEIRAAKRLLESEILKTAGLERKEELRCERARIVSQERDEENVVRAGLGLKLQPWIKHLRHNGSAAGLFELLLAKARVALRYECCRPELLPAGSGKPLKAENMFNPEISEILERQGKSFTPVSIGLEPGTTLLTGANMGGKTVALLTLAMNAELALLGFFVSARSFTMPMFDFIFLMAGDGQSQAAGLSSFGAEIIRLSELIALTRQGNGLAICDEFARSTNPSEGSRFVQALGEFLQNSGSYGVIATHYDGIKIENAAYYQVVGLKNKAALPAGADRDMLLRNLCDNMDYRLVRISGDYQVPKDALHIAGILDVDPDFMTILRRHYPADSQ